ncbi:hypothetical protein PLEOSDRAFT_1106041 [Pleurotus ostreatus PC15]|uniref:Uncharacterized protein n=1 Tax=Pleurotus ostreatus (strain PC15) TaxID=1137138 RepID=A0A067NSS8_PLEO1|nr:hypothetical protein PLEOSDRAFT_1106041 [Pleurotus ostreatus PC15]
MLEIYPSIEAKSVHGFTDSKIQLASLVNTLMQLTRVGQDENLNRLEEHDFNVNPEDLEQTMDLAVQKLKDHAMAEIEAEAAEYEGSLAAAWPTPESRLKIVAFT